MKQTAVEKMIQYFIEQKNNGASHWCIDDLIAQLHQAKAMEKEQIINAYEEQNVEPEFFEDGTMAITNKYTDAEQYYNETFKSE
jgi:hypothetical protein